MVAAIAISRATAAIKATAEATLQDKLLAWTPKVMASFSIPSSLFIIWEALSDHRRGKGTAIQRALVGMSIVDVFASTAWFTSTWAVPVGSGPLARGSVASCDWQGFLLQLAIGAPLYNCSLALYYVLVIRYNWTNEQLVKIERFVHSFIISFTVGTSIAGLPLTMYNRVGSVCWVIGSPPDCGNSSAGPTNEDVPCDRGDHAWLFGIFLFYVPLWSSVLLTVFAMLLIYVQVQRTFGKTQTYLYADNSTSSNRHIGDSGNRTPSTAVHYSGSSNFQHGQTTATSSFEDTRHSGGGGDSQQPRQKRRARRPHSSTSSSARPEQQLRLSNSSSVGGGGGGLGRDSSVLSLEESAAMAMASINGTNTAPESNNKRQPFIPVTRDSRFNRISIFHPNTGVDEEETGEECTKFQVDPVTGDIAFDPAIIMMNAAAELENYDDEDDDHDDDVDRKNSNGYDDDEEMEVPETRGNRFNWLYQVRSAATATASRIVESRQHSKQQLFATQAILYSVSFFVTWSPSTIWSVTSWFGVETFGLSYAAAFCEPLQGFWNMLIFVRRRPTSRAKIYNFFCRCSCIVQLCGDKIDYFCFCCKSENNNTNNGRMMNGHRRRRRFLTRSNKNINGLSSSGSRPTGSMAAIGGSSTNCDVSRHHIMSSVAERSLCEDSENSQSMHHHYPKGENSSRHDDDEEHHHDQQQQLPPSTNKMKRPTSRRMTPLGHVSTIYDNDGDEEGDEDTDRIDENNNNDNNSTNLNNHNYKNINSIADRQAVEEEEEHRNDSLSSDIDLSYDDENNNNNDNHDTNSHKTKDKECEMTQRDDDDDVSACNSDCEDEKISTQNPNKPDETENGNEAHIPDGHLRQ